MAASSPHLLAISPHLDDAILSASGTLHRAHGQGWNITIVTLFAGDALLPLTPAAQRLHQIWGLGTNAPTARRSEDRAAAETIGASVLHCELPDAVYRGSSNDVFRRALNPTDRELLTRSIELLTSAYRTILPELVLGPVGIGGHIDHRLTALACDALEDCTQQTVYRWFDQPYSWHASYGSKSEQTFLDEVLIDRKLDSIACYPSQLSIVFDREDDSWRDDVREFGSQERFAPHLPPLTDRLAIG